MTSLLLQGQQGRDTQIDMGILGVFYVTFVGSCNPRRGLEESYVIDNVVTEYGECVLNAFAFSSEAGPVPRVKQSCGNICGWNLKLSFYVPAAYVSEC